MKDIKVGEYIRSIHGEIAMVSTVLDNRVVTYPYGNIYYEEMIKKHSKNPIDLIEEGDVIEYYISGVVRVGKVKKYNEGLGIGFYKLEQIGIKKILTCEQFEDNCYEVCD